MKSLSCAILAVSALLSGSAAYAETYRVDRAEGFYSCSSEADAMTLMTTTYTLPYWDAVSTISGFEKSTCPVYTVTTGMIPADTLIVEPIDPPTIYDQWAIIKWSDVTGQTFYTPIIRSASNGLWYDSVSTLMDVRAINGVLDIFQ